MAEKFQHAPLNHTAREILLLKLLHADQDNDEPHVPQYIIEHVDLDSDPRFKAISYTWGSPNNTGEILIEGKPYTIRSNLWAFLAQKSQDRPFNESSWLWIDQICINQEDGREHTHQVGQMTGVYSKAEEVLIWLGYGKEKLIRAMDKIAAGPSQWHIEWRHKGKGVMSPKIGER